MQYKGFGDKLETSLLDIELDSSLGLLKETGFPDVGEQTASELYQAMPFDEGILGPFKSNIERDPNFYIDDDYEQFRKDEGIE